LQIDSNNDNSAGQIANAIQGELKKGAFGLKGYSNVRVTKMDVPTCDEIIEDFSMAKLDSSAAVASTLIAFLVAFVNLL